MDPMEPLEADAGSFTPSVDVTSQASDYEVEDETDEEPFEDSQATLSTSASFLLDAIDFSPVRRVIRRQQARIMSSGPRIAYGMAAHRPQYDPRPNLTYRT